TIQLQQEAVRLTEQEAAANDKAAAAVKAKAAKDDEAAGKAKAKAAADAMATRESERGNRSALKFTGSLVGLGAAGGVAGVAIAAGLVGVPLLMAGLALTVQQGTDEMQRALMDTGSELHDGLEEITAPLRDELVLATEQVTAGFRKMRPELKAIAAEAGPAVTMLVDGVVKLAVNALPGMRKSVQESGQAVAGLNALLDHTGTGISDFFAEISEGAPAAGRSAGELGLILEDLLGFAGRIVAMLANDFQGTFADARVVIDQTTDAVEGLGGGAFPALAATGSTVLGVVSSILGALGPMAPAIGTVVGVMLSARAGAAVFGAAGDAIGRAGDKMQAAEPKGSKLGGAVRGLGSALSIIGPYGAIAGAAIFGVSAAADAAFGSVDQLTAKLMQGGAAAEQAGKKLSQNSAFLAPLTEFGQWLGSKFIPTMADATVEIASQREAMTVLQRAQLDASAAAANHSLAVDRFGKNSKEAAAASAILGLRQQQLRDAQSDAARATQTLVERMQEQLGLSLLLAGNNLALRMSTTAYEQAQKNLNDTLKTGTATSLEIRAAKEQVESASLRVIEAAGKEASAHFANQASVEAQTAALHAQQAKALELAAAMEGPLPAALQTVIANMDDATLSASGATRTIDGTGAAVIRLPDGKEVKISAQDNASTVIHGVKSNLDTLQDKWINVFINEVVGNKAPNTNPSNLPLPLPTGGVVPPRADGGPLKAGQMYKVGERGQEYAMFPSDGYMFDASQTRAIDQMVRGMGTSSVPAARGGDAPMMGGGQTVHKTNNVTLNAIPGIQTMQQLRDMQHEAEVLYG
ncbi:MAG: hypothetical protein QOF58_1565, partial [Pseudonocardiales bacterium]|nr:hypothetical protein [Pseudonocardiales bacterium]